MGIVNVNQSRILREQVYPLRRVVAPGKMIHKSATMKCQMRDHDQDKLDWLPPKSAMPSLIEHWRQQRYLQLRASVSVSAQVSAVTAQAHAQAVNPHPDVDVLIQTAAVRLGDQTADGQIISGVAVPWFEIISQLGADPDFLFKVPWRKLEEIVAGAYAREGWQVILTPRSGDRGRDVIATRPGVCSIRIVDQIKAYKRGHVVTADEVRSMLGVLDVDRNVSKGIVTTTSRFAPGIEKDSGIEAFMPYRLELKDGEQVRQFLLEAGSNRSNS